MPEILLKIIISLLSIFVFWWLESGFLIKNDDEMIKSIIFGVVFSITLFSRYRKYLFLVSLCLLGLMVLTYMFWQIAWSDTLASLGYGILVITVFSYTIQLIKNGFVEKL